MFAVVGKSLCNRKKIIIYVLNWLWNFPIKMEIRNR